MTIKNLIDFSNLGNGRGSLIVDESVTLPDFGSYRFPKPFHVTAEIDRHDTALDIYGHAHTEYAGQCDRCLEEYAAPLNITIDEQFPLTLPPGPLSENNVVHEGRLDLADLVRQLVDASLPYVSLCRPDCAGLCLTCGSNRNEGLCGCEAATKGDHGKP